MQYNFSINLKRLQKEHLMFRKIEKLFFFFFLPEILSDDILNVSMLSVLSDDVVLRC